MTMKTWYAYLMSRNNNIYIGLKTGNDERAWRWDMPMDDALARLRRCFKYIRTNYDEHRTPFDRDMQEKDCKFLANNLWRKDCGLQSLNNIRGGR